MDIKFLDPEIARKLLEGHKDVLTDEAERQEQWYADKTCPRCGGNCRRVGQLSSMFKNGKPLPQYQLECLACECVFDPHSGIVLELGNIGQAVEPAIPILKTED